MKIFSKLQNHSFLVPVNVFFEEKIVKPVSQLKNCERGVGAVEFALVIPLLLVMYVGAVEISVAMSIDKKVSQASSVASDIISQMSATDEDTLGQMLGVAQSVIAPFDASSLDLEVVGISIDGSGNATVAWSWDEEDNRPLVVGDPITIPTAYAIPDTFLLRTTLELDHDLLMVTPLKAGAEYTDATITLNKQYYMHQREAEEIVCSDC